MTHKSAFTLSEVLVTLGIIGIVATMTIPTLIKEYKQKAWDESSRVFEIKLGQALKVMNTEQTLAGYNKTEDFVNELSKHFKITKICSAKELTQCFENTVLWGGGETDKTEVDMTSIKTAKNMGLDDWNTNVVGVQFANGANGVIAYNPDCTQNPYSNQIINLSQEGKLGTNCIALLYDTTAYKAPNESGKDLRSINVSKLAKTCAFELNGTCYGKGFLPTALSKADCEKEKDRLKIKECNDNDDVWAGAVKACGGTDKMPTLAQINELAKYLYNTDKISDQFGVLDKNLTLDTKKAAELGFSLDSSNYENYFAVWSGEEIDDETTTGRAFTASQTNAAYGYRGVATWQALCLE